MSIEFKMAPGMKVIELGGGANPRFHPNVDVRQCYDTAGNSTVDIGCDFNEDKPLPITSEEWDAVVMIFCLEHLSYRRIPSFLKEVVRILKAGGKFCCITSNTEAQVKWIQEHTEGWDGRDYFNSASGKLFGDQTYDSNCHRCFFNPQILAKLFQEAGFTTVKMQPYGARDTDIYVEGTKPMVVVPPIRDATPLESPTPTQTPVLGVQREGAPSTLAQIPIATLGAVVNTAEMVDQPQTPPLVSSSGVNAPGRPNGHANNRAALFGKQYYENYRNSHMFYFDYPCHENVARAVLAKRPESVIELGCGRGYVVKRLQDAGIDAYGMDFSYHCRLTKVCNNLLIHDASQSSWPGLDHRRTMPDFDFCLSVALLEHVPETDLANLLREVGIHTRCGLHAIDFNASPEDDPTRVTLHPYAWWRQLFDSYGLQAHELCDKAEIEAGHHRWKDGSTRGLPQDYLEGDGKKKCNLGSAVTMFHHGWDNIDTEDLERFAQPNDYRFLRHDMRNGLPYKTSEVDMLFLHHTLEHFTYQECVTLLREMRRVIKPTGVVRIAVPDAEYLTSLYQASSDPSCIKLRDYDELNDGCKASPTAVGKMWALLGEGHKSAFDSETLLTMLADAKFHAGIGHFRVATRLWSDWQSMFVQLQREVIEMSYQGVSLFIDAVPMLG